MCVCVFFFLSPFISSFNSWILMVYDLCLQFYYYYYYWECRHKIANYTCSVIIVTHFECYAKVSTLSLDAADAIWAWFFSSFIAFASTQPMLLSHSFHDCEDRKSISKDKIQQSERCIWECDSWSIVKIPFATEKIEYIYLYMFFFFFFLCLL